MKLSELLEVKEEQSKEQERQSKLENKMKAFFGSFSEILTVE